MNIKSTIAIFLTGAFFVQCSGRTISNIDVVSASKEISQDTTTFVKHNAPEVFNDYFTLNIEWFSEPSKLVNKNLDGIILINFNNCKITLRDEKMRGRKLLSEPSVVFQDGRLPHQMLAPQEGVWIGDWELDIIDALEYQDWIVSESDNKKRTFIKLKVNWSRIYVVN